MTKQPQNPSVRVPFYFYALALLLPALLLGFYRPLAIYFLVIAPALPVIVLVLFVQLRQHWSQPEIAVGLCTLTGFAIGYLILFFRFANLITTQVQRIMGNLPAS
ncbi:MAG: hypothetical protein JO316_13780 [Abitibacteriaceae bacterium]|nr:hypothetical protein [Abditibacteriaceae bacterium]MBV9866418.1 hypothetical protein [Abditibacteriaceae bacterium]